jgi:hypothetical protein
VEREAVVSHRQTTSALEQLTRHLAIFLTELSEHWLERVEKNVCEALGVIEQLVYNALDVVDDW